MLSELLQAETSEIRSTEAALLRFDQCSLCFHLTKIDPACPIDRIKRPKHDALAVVSDQEQEGGNSIGVYFSFY